MRTFTISDTHFSHKKIIEFRNKTDPSRFMREFSSIDEMNQTMIDNWNRVVGDDDIIYHLGDFSFGGKQNIAYFAQQLKGRKRLIMGNHDYNAHDYVNYFEQVMSWKEIRTKKGVLILTHAPLYLGSFDYRHSNPSINVHGHLHDQVTGEPYHVSVCVEQVNYTPVDIDEIISTYL